MADDAGELAARLRAVGQGLSVRVPDDLADRVLAGIAVAPAKRFVHWRRWLSALAAILAAVGVSAAVSAPVRAAIVQLFGFGGVEVLVGSGPSPAPSPLLPGEHRTDIDGAQREVGFRVRLPSTLGAPEWVTVADGRVVSLFYQGGAVRIDEFAGDLGVMWDKYVQMAAQRTAVDGSEALWFDEPITLVYVDSSGVERSESARLTSSTLVWTDGGLTIRLDGIRPMDAALAVARSMR
jgi:hypothetical protein